MTSQHKQKTGSPTSSCEAMQAGYITLSAVIIILSVALLISISASFFAALESDMGFIQSQAAISYFLASACAEHALIELKNDLNYTGNETMTIDGQNCFIDIIDEVLEGNKNQYRIITASSNINNIIKKVRVKIMQVNPEIIIRSWREVAEL